MKFLDRRTIELLKEKYKEGTRVRLIYMEDDLAVPEGTEGTIVGVDGMGNILMKWDNGRGLSLIPRADKFEIIG